MNQVLATNKVTAFTSIDNSAGTNPPRVFALALYKGTELKNVMFKQVPLTALQNISSVSLDMIMPDEALTGYTMKAFLWSDLTSSFTPVVTNGSLQ